MKRVVIESPYAGNVEANVAYAKRCVRDCLARGEAPYASHLFFTQEELLRDDVPDERRLGMEAGFAWGAAADLVAVYVDRGVSSGMREGVSRAARGRQRHFEIRWLDPQDIEPLVDLVDGLFPQGLRDVLHNQGLRAVVEMNHADRIEVTFDWGQAPVCVHPPSKRLEYLEGGPYAWCRVCGAVEHHDGWHLPEGES